MRLRYIYLYFLMMTLTTVPLRAQDMAGSDIGSNIVSRTMLSPDGARSLTQRVFDNGLGDIVQETQYYPGTTLPVVVVHHEYDDYRRRTRSWLPVTSSDSVFVSGGTVATMAGSQYSDAAPFSRTEYDGFLPSQPAATFKAGVLWQGNNKKDSVTYSEYVGAGMFINADMVGYMYTLPGVKYLRTRMVDEDGCPGAEYTDFNGRLIISETSQGRTYYIYDERGDIRYVIPPILSEYILSHYGSDSEDILDSDDMMRKYAYIYRYDKQHHCIYKKLPGCDPIYYVYDRTGTLILTQDGNQRQRYEWTYTIPDKFGRPCVSGVCSKMISYAAEPLHSAYVYAEYDGTSTATGGYTVHNFTLGSQTLYSAAYYDGYSFIGHHGVPSSLAASTVPGFPIDTSLGHGLQTGSATAVLDGGGVTGYTFSAMYYESRYNVAQVKSTGTSIGDEITCTSYSFTGKPLSVWTQHTTTGTGTLEVNCTYTYDDADRLASRTLSIANGGSAASSTLTYAYDDLGRLSKVTRPFTTANVSKDVTYTYDLHGWTTGITTNSFREELFYADGPGTPRYNGNISAMRWQNNNYNNKRGYKFTYDDANRLTQAKYGEGVALTSNVNRFKENLQYDAHGNITGITRYGCFSTNNFGSLYGQMDNLTLSYDGNQLTGVSETATDHDFAGSFEYKRARGSQYMYDRNGSLVADKSRGIAYITYDRIGNPYRIYFTNGNVTKYSYNATGQKLGVEYYVATPNVTVPFGAEPDALTQGQTMYAGSRQYLLGGSLVMEDGMIDKFLFDGGYAQASAVNPTTYSFSFYYYNQDHLGNNREVVDSAGTVKQVTNYYPFGTPYTDTTTLQNASLQPYKYNGKELDRMHGLNTYDYGARQYNPVTARWDRMDPLCEKYYSISPYAYCGGNPVNRIDPDGRFWGDYLTGKGEFIGSDGIDDGKLYVLKTSKSTFDSYGNVSADGITRKEYRRVIKEHDISNKNNFVEITGDAEIRKSVISKIEDNGKGGTVDNNNREYIITFDSCIGADETNMIYCRKGPVGHLAENESVYVNTGSSTDIVHIHTHPSGEKDGIKWFQAPSEDDVNNTTTQSYVIGMRDKTVYIYNGNGINATLPLKVYENYEVTNGK